MTAEHSSAPTSSQLIRISNKSPVQGETVKVEIECKNCPPPEFVKLENKKWRVFKGQEENLYEALIVVPATIKPGDYNLRFADTALETSADMHVQSGKFAIQRMKLPKGKDNFNASPGEKEAIADAKRSWRPEKLYQGQFIKPVEKYRQSAQFGVRRIVNGHLLDDYFHSGCDFAASVGTPVKAVNNGVVILAKTGYKLHGNTICIDHGHGVISIYIHMNSIKVKSGDVVKSGDIIGTVGQTGRASGPHLHFSVYVSEVAANPKFWFEKIY